MNAPQHHTFARWSVPSAYLPQKPRVDAGEWLRHTIETRRVRHQRFIGVACCALSAVVVLYFIGQLLRAVLS